MTSTQCVPLQPVPTGRSGWMSMVLSPVCVTLQLVDGYPIERIAAITGMAEGTVKSHLFRGKQKLTAFLRQNGYS